MNIFSKKYLFSTPSSALDYNVIGLVVSGKNKTLLNNSCHSKNHRNVFVDEVVNLIKGFPLFNDWVLCSYVKSHAETRRGWKKGLPARTKRTTFRRVNIWHKGKRLCSYWFYELMWPPSSSVIRQTSSTVAKTLSNYQTLSNSWKMFMSTLICFAWNTIGNANLSCASHVWLSQSRHNSGNAGRSKNLSALI